MGRGRSGPTGGNRIRQKTRLVMALMAMLLVMAMLLEVAYGDVMVMF